MLPTWVFGWPTGKETGSYLAVDLGGTNLRVCEVELEGNGKFAITQSKYKLTEEQKLGDGQALCGSNRTNPTRVEEGMCSRPNMCHFLRLLSVDFCAECLASFIQDHYTNDDGSVYLDKDIALGFTFSYPCV